jgi:hypothetical protein
VATAGPSQALRAESLDQKERECPGREPRQLLDITGSHHAMAAGQRWLVLTGTDTRKAECKKRIEDQKIRRATINILIYTIAVGRFKMTMETRATIASPGCSAWNGKHLEDDSSTSCPAPKRGRAGRRLSRGLVGFTPFLILRTSVVPRPPRRSQPTLGQASGAPATVPAHPSDSLLGRGPTCRQPCRHGR